MIYTKKYRQQSTERIEKLDDALGIVEGAITELAMLTKDTVKSVKGDFNLEDLLDKMMANVGDLYVYKNKLLEEVSGEIEE
jgi:hypothetical protein